MVDVAIVELEDALHNHGLQNVDFPFLEEDTHFARLLMFQPTGTVVATNLRVGPLDVGLMKSQMISFMTQAKGLEVDIAACPEYSCPWAAVSESIQAGLFPSAGKLWVIACESATQTEWEGFIQDVGDHVRVIFDVDKLSANGTFIDAICYMFNAVTDENDPVKVVIIQPKTHEMGGDDFERSNLKIGSILYRFQNAHGNTNSLITFICSDTLNATLNNLLGNILGKCLVLHLQLNENPSSPSYRSYREFFCNNAPRSTEILCLNWASGTMLLGQEKPFVTEPKTILFRDYTDLDARDPRIKENHAKGCYLTNWKHYRTAAFVFSPDPHLFYLETTKPSTAGPAANARRTGPRMLAAFSWNAESAVWTALATDVDDGFRTYWLQHAGIEATLLSTMPEYLDAERLIQLCTGHALEAGWAKWKNLRSFELAEDDTACRLTTCWSTKGSGPKYRQECLSLFKVFTGLVANQQAFSSRLTRFKESPFSVSYIDTPAKEFRNLHQEGLRSATAIYVGEAPDTSKLQEVKKRVTRELEKVEADTDLLAIWYRDEHGEIRDLMDSEIPEISRDPGSSAVAIDNA